jgi:predicted lipoprotein with Yx(FWY)xxD motif
MFLIRTPTASPHAIPLVPAYGRPWRLQRAQPATGDYTIIARDDGSKQWAYKKRPLYNWKNDQKAGDITGDGVGGGWHIAQP